jgi:transposase
MRRYGLRDDQWDRIKDLLRGREGHVGGTAKDNRLSIEAVLYRFRTGCSWRALPMRFGHWKAIHQRFSRWAKSGVFERIFKLLAKDHDNEYMMIDTHHCARSAAQRRCAKKTEREPSADRAAGQAPKSKGSPTR